MTNSKLCLVAILSTLFLSGSAVAEDLYRLRMLPISTLNPGGTTVLSFVVDHTRVPAPDDPDPGRAIQVFSFGVQLPEGVSYSSHTFDGTNLKQVLHGQDPWFGTVESNDDGFSVSVVGDAEFAEVLQEGRSQVVLNVTVTSSDDAPLGSADVSFTDFDDPDQYLWFLMPMGRVTPHTQSGSLVISNGTGPAVEIDDTEYPDPDDLPFPEPTDEELEPMWISQEAPVGGPGIQMFGAGMGGSGSDPDCVVTLPVDLGYRDCVAPASAIQVGMTTTSIINVDGRPTVVSNVEVLTEVSHPPSSFPNFRMEVTNPTGTTVLLYNSAGDEDVNLVWRDSAFADTYPLDHDCYCEKQTFGYAAGPGLGAFTSLGADGDWTLTVTDQRMGTLANGSLDEWCIIIDNPATLIVDESATIFDPGTDRTAYASIQEAIDVVSSGDEYILVLPGDDDMVYEERICIDPDDFVGGANVALWAARQGIEIRYDGADELAGCGTVLATESAPTIMIWETDVAATAAASITIGWVQTPADTSGAVDTSGWRGFSITDGQGGSLGDLRPGGIHVNAAGDVTVAILGNVITDNGQYDASENSGGGGIGVTDSTDVTIYQNEINGNRAPSGGGISTLDSDVGIHENWIHDNRVGSDEGLQPLFAGSPVGVLLDVEGGGVHVTGGDVRICSNQIYSNVAVQGAGVYAYLDATGGGPFLHFAHNDVYENSPYVSAVFEFTPICQTGEASWPTGYVGGGLLVTGSTDAAVVGLHHLAILSNDIHHNKIWYDDTELVGGEAAQVDPCIDLNELPSQVGGGVFLALPLDTATADQARYMVNNFVYQNEARGRAGGVWLDAAGQAAAAVDDAPFYVYHNTLIDNIVQDRIESATFCEPDDVSFGGAGLTVGFDYSPSQDTDISDVNVSVKLDCGTDLISSLTLTLVSDGFEVILTELEGGMLTAMDVTFDNSGGAFDGSALNRGMVMQPEEPMGSDSLDDFATFGDEDFTLRIEWDDPLLTGDLDEWCLEITFDGSLVEGSELYLPVLPVDSPSEFHRTYPDEATRYSLTDGANNVVYNLTGGVAGDDVSDWYASCDQTDPVGRLNPGPWVSNQMRDEPTSATLLLVCDPTAIPPDANYPIFEDDGDATQDDNADPEVVNSTAGPGYDPHLSVTSPCIDEGADTTGFPFDVLGLDIDGHDRPFPIAGVADRGADEYAEFFKRGDCDNNGEVEGLIDALYLLDSAFSGGPPVGCREAADCDGDGVYFPLVDASYLLAWATSGGPPPPAPGPDECGVDPDYPGLGCATLPVACN